MNGDALLRECRDYLVTWHINVMGNRCHEIVQRIDAYLAHPPRSAEEVRKDAERYRWLNAQDNFMIYIESQPAQRMNVRLKCGQALDRWIDAALDQSGKEK